MPDISIVIPVYRAQGCLQELYRRTKASLKEVTSDFEIIFVEDCGGDGSWGIITELAYRDEKVKGIQLSRNFGQHYAITAGLDYCVGDWVVVMDCDLQDPPEAIPQLYRKAKEGYEVVLAKRVQRKDCIVKCISSWLFYKFFSFLADTQYDWRIGNFRIMSRKVVVNFSHMRENLRFFSGLVDWMGFPTASIEIEHAPRFEGKTSYTLKKLLFLARDAIIAYSDKPLRLTISLGFLMAFCSFIIGCYYLLHVLRYGSPIIGWASLIVSLYFIGGVIIFILGIIGIYLSKTFEEAKKRPLYLIREVTSHEKK